MSVLFLDAYREVDGCSMYIHINDAVYNICYIVCKNVFRECGSRLAFVAHLASNKYT